MKNTALHLILAAAIATVSIAPAAAHAQPAGGSSGGSHGKSCDDDGRVVEDGYRSTFRTRYMRGSTTCTDGTICTSTGTLQQDGKTRVWTYECHDAPAARTHPVVRLPRPTTVIRAAAA